jgi:hypothetical protein
MNEAMTPSDTDGVLVASAWRTAGGDLLVRISMTRPGDENETVRAVTTADEAVSCFEEWLSELHA